MKTSSLHLLAGFCLALFFHHGVVKSQNVRPITEINNSGSGIFTSITDALGGKERARERCNKYISHFNSRSSRACAILFDEDNCDGKFEVVPEGYTEINDDLEDDAESVLVRPGCTLVGHDREKGSFRGTGDSITISNVDGGSFNRNEPLLRNLSGDDDLEEEIEAVDCRCQSPTQTKSGSSSTISKIGGFFGIGGAGRTSAGNAADKEDCRTKFSSGNAADCIVYDDEDCQVEDWNEPLVLTRGQERAFKVLTSFSYRNTIESVSVRAGCRLEVYDDSSFGEDDSDRYVFRAPNNANLHVTLDESSEGEVRDLDDDINSIRCLC